MYLRVLSFYVMIEFMTILLPRYDNLVGHCFWNSKDEKNRERNAFPA